MQPSLSTYLTIPHSSFNGLPPPSPLPFPVLSLPPPPPSSLSISPLFLVSLPLTLSAPPSLSLPPLPFPCAFTPPPILPLPLSPPFLTPRALSILHLSSLRPHSPCLLPSFIPSVMQLSSLPLPIMAFDLVGLLLLSPSFVLPFFPPASPLFLRALCFSLSFPLLLSIVPWLLLFVFSVVLAFILIPITSIPFPVSTPSLPLPLPYLASPLFPSPSSLPLHHPPYFLPLFPTPNHPYFTSQPSSPLFSSPFPTPITPYFLPPLLYPHPCFFIITLFSSPLPIHPPPISSPSSLPSIITPIFFLFPTSLPPYHPIFFPSFPTPHHHPYFLPRLSLPTIPFSPLFLPPSPYYPSLLPPSLFPISLPPLFPHFPLLRSLSPESHEYALPDLRNVEQMTSAPAFMAGRV
ncbi:hypothetical protein C7M84_020059 [Penaeus vannamei]|uniref:Uncharacterized protein n=1 Tax=Penaeus vannamei TaxID=6689 RepID=A0A3R7PDB4_PENVA|nr:hypothetical protein C7M84_020059 [Penaeus vannamei]